MHGRIEIQWSRVTVIPTGDRSTYNAVVSYARHRRDMNDPEAYWTFKQTLLKNLVIITDCYPDDK
jgi:hypothetical protein